LCQIKAWPLRDPTLRHFPVDGGKRLASWVSQATVAQQLVPNLRSSGVQAKATTACALAQAVDRLSAFAFNVHQPSLPQPVGSPSRAFRGESKLAREALD